MNYSQNKRDYLQFCGSLSESLSKRIVGDFQLSNLLNEEMNNLPSAGVKYAYLLILISRDCNECSFWKILLVNHPWWLCLLATTRFLHLTDHQPGVVLVHRIKQHLPHTKDIPRCYIKQNVTFPLGFSLLLVIFNFLKLIPCLIQKAPVLGESG